MKRSRLVPFAALAVAGLLGVSACGSSSSTATAEAEKNLAFSQLPTCPRDALEKAKKPVEITMWTDALAASMNTMEAITERFNKSQSDVKVTVVKPGGDATNSDYLDTAFLQVADPAQLPPGAKRVDVPASAGKPALMQMSSYRIRKMADSGLVLPAQSCINAYGFDTSGIAPVAKAYYTIGGVQWPSYIVPSTTIMGYNADQFRKAGLNPDNPPKTLDELEAAARKLKASGVQFPISMPADPDLVVSWLTGAGATLVSDGNGRTAPPARATFFTQAAVDLYTQLQRMIKDGLINLTENESKVDYLVALATGTSSITFMTSSGSTSVAKVVEGDQRVTEQAQNLQGGGALGGVATKDYRAAPLPGLKGPGQVTIRGSAWYISSVVPPEQQAAAWKFSEYFYKLENQVEMVTEFGSLPLTTEAASDPRIVKFFAEGGLAGNWLGTAAGQLKSADPALPGPLIGPYDEFVTTIRKSLNELRPEVGANPSQVLTNAENEFTKELTKYNTLHG